MIFGKLVSSQCRYIMKKFYSNKLHLTTEQIIQDLYKMAKSKSRENPIIMKLETPEFRSIFNDEIYRMVSIFKEYGYEIRIAGGAVRDLLMGKTPKDLDFATTATPTQMKHMFLSENIRMINMNGEKHGTITPRINDKENFEVTTLRIDVVTDGRHAEVQFTTDWLLDALRRDLTINSMFLDLDGYVYDYFFGYEDLKNRKITFVGNATDRIREDYLRILRYFRFYGRIAREPNNHDNDILIAIKENVSGLERISGERIWMELKKILDGNFAGNIMKTIIQCGLAPYIGLPHNPNIRELDQVWQRSGHLNLNAVTLLASLLYTESDAVALNARLKLSAFERDLALFITKHRSPEIHPKTLLSCQQLVVKAKSKPLDIKKMVIEVLKYNNSNYLTEFEMWNIPKFPVGGNILKDCGIESGQFMGVVISELRHFWADNNFSLSTEELLKEVPRILNELAVKKKKK